MRIIIDKANIKIGDEKVIIDLDSAQLENFLEANRVPLSTLKPQDEFKIGDEIFVVLEQTDYGTKVVAKKFVYTNMAFGECSDWKKSPIRSLLNSEYYNKISEFIGEHNIIPIKRDLTSLDGLDDYGTCTDKITLLSAYEYGKYHKILGLKPDYPTWWWTITSTSTPSNDYSRSVCCVSSSGVLDWGGRGCCYGVRPFCILNSSVSVLKNTD